MRQWISSSAAEAQLKVLTSIGALRHVDNASVVRCYACDETHETAVEMVSLGRFRAYCPDAGYQDVSAHDLEVYAVDIPALAASIRRGLEMPPNRPIDELLTGRLWRLGEQRFGRILSSIYFARQLGESGALDAVGRALRAFPEQGPGVIFSSSPVDRAHSFPLAPYVVAPLDRYAELSNQHLRLDQNRIAAALRGDDSQVCGVGVQFAPDYRQVRIGQEAYRFTPKQAEAIRVMHEAHRLGTAQLSQHHILAAAKSDQKRLAHLFRDHPAWGTLIKGDRGGLTGSTYKSRRRSPNAKAWPSSVWTELSKDSQLQP